LEPAIGWRPNLKMERMDGSASWHGKKRAPPGDSPEDGLSFPELAPFLSATQSIVAADAASAIVQWPVTDRTTEAIDNPS
jgi:hypothetical protein